MTQLQWRVINEDGIYFATTLHFIDTETSIVGAGATPGAAINDLLKDPEFKSYIKQIKAEAKSRGLDSFTTPEPEAFRIIE